jgi:hypothetical protein
MCHQETFANGSFMAINMVVLNDEHGFPFGYKKALHSHVRLIIFRFIVTGLQGACLCVDDQSCAFVDNPFFRNQLKKNITNAWAVLCAIL